MNRAPSIDSGAWTLRAASSLTEAAALDGGVGLQFGAVAGSFDPPVPSVSGGAEVVITVVPGQPATFGALVRRDSGAGLLFLSVEEPVDSENWSEVASLIDPVVGEVSELSGTYTPSASTVRLRINAVAPTGSGDWSADGLTFEDGLSAEETTMAVTLSERVVRDVLCTLQNHLAAELARVDSARGDGLGLPAPDRWFDYQHPAWLGSTCQLEVFEDGIRFVAPEQDASAGGQHCSTEVSVVVRVTHAARGNPQVMPASQVMARSRRYLAALRNVIADNRTLGSSVTEQYSGLRAASVYVGAPDFRPDAQSLGGKVEMNVLVTQREDRTGEDTPGGGALQALPTAVS